MAEVLIIGQPDDATLDAAADLGWRHLHGLDALAQCSDDECAQVRAIAYKGHHAFGGEIMDRFPNLGIIANYGVGYDAIDVTAASDRGIKVTNTPDVLNDDVADLAVAMLLAYCRDICGAQGYVRSGNWATGGEYPLQRKVTGARCGILGMGRIGREIADRLAAFKMEMHYHARSAKETPGWTFHADPVSLARDVDFLVVALVGGPDTVGYVSREVLEALGPQGVIVNISRGTTIDEGAMIEMLEGGALGGAGLDVFLNEPDPDPRFRTLPRCVLQPHQASGTRETRAAMGTLQRENVLAFLAGEDLKTPVN